MDSHPNNELIEASDRFIEYYGSDEAREHVRRVLDSYQHAVTLARQRALEKLELPTSNVIPFPRQPESVPDSVA